MKRVYFIKPIGMDGPIKIGCSQSPDNRRKTLEVWSPFALEIVAEIEGDMNVERRFHALFRSAWLRGEWFNATPELRATIASIAVGSFDLACLPDPERLPRSPHGNSYATPEWRYRASVVARFRHRGGYPYWNDDFKVIVKDDLHGDWLPHKAAIEALIERSPVRRAA